MLPAGMDDISLYKKKTPVWPFLLAAAAALGGGAFVLVPRHGASKEPAAVAPQPTATAEHVTPAAAPQEAPKVETVKVRISVDPADAIVKLDGRILSARPFVAALPKDNAFHELTAFADGCRDGRQTVHLNRDVAVLVSLKCSGQAARSALRTAPLRSFAGAPSPAQPQAAAAEPQPAAPAAEPAKDPQPPPAEPAPPAAPPDENPYKSEVFRKSL
jgi:hypothetical protein